MPMYDRQCLKCGHQLIDCWEPMDTSPVTCPECGAMTQRVWLTRANAVIQDSIEGGVWIRHGLCDLETGEPVKYYSKSEIAKEAKKRGLEQFVRHAPEPGSDRSKFTTRWI